LLDELRHRIANSLQIIAGIILMKANAVSSEETRILLQDTHDRVISIATVQEQLSASGTVGSIESYRRILVTDGVRRQRFELAI
jgi:two-component sensor histidine kinase